MIALASTWLGLALLICAFAYFARRWLAALLLLPATVTAALALYIPLGAPNFTSPPPGKYSVLGAKIVVDEAIYVLLDNGEIQPAYYVLPYSTASANQLQNAMDEAGEGGVMALADGEGGVEYDGEPPVTGDEPKTAEQPALNLGGAF